MNNFTLEVDSETIKNFISKIIQNKSSDIFKQLFNKTTKINFDQNTASFKVVIFKYFLKIIKIPENINGTFLFEHNLPLTFFNLDNIPDYITIDKTTITLNLPENVFFKNMKIKEIYLRNNDLKVDLYT